MRFLAVYTQHVPLLVQTIEGFKQGKDNGYSSAGPSSKGPRETIVVLITGGVTFEESRAVAQMNQAGRGPRVLLVGTAMLNSAIFIACIEKALETV